MHHCLDNIQMFVFELLEENATGMPTWFTVLSNQKSGRASPSIVLKNEYLHNSTCIAWVPI
ncbi:hypothetical protein Taro_022805 [Colocasia esculenta]|uniref:Uncharacterized protein n=1 Tax=Colocasia esculenta TaxID=4460 RepID=A0A843V6D6_COLES|nr:hypothetical protein [Colocasia esculenta]